nr:hypothetical protein [Hyphomonas sp. Mor2]
MSARQHEILDPSALSGLSVWPGSRTPGLGEIVITTKDLDAAQRQQYARALNRHYYACGCSEASVGILLGIVLALAAMAVGGIGLSSLGLFALPLAGLVLGKLFGLARAQARLKATIRDIQSVWTPDPAPEPALRLYD